MSDMRAGIREKLRRLVEASDADLSAALKDAVAGNVQWDLSHPVNRLDGAEAVLSGFVHPLRRALDNVRRRDEIFIGGANRRANGGDWIASVTHYVGNFVAPLFGIEPNGKLVFVRSGEFYRIENGRVVEARLIVDLIDLMRQVGQMPLPQILGTEMLFPGPATHDGVCPPHRERGPATLDVVEGMLADLHSFDPETFESKDQTGKDGYWHRDMLWYGPGGIGSNYRWSGFVKDHRESFLIAFPDRKGGDHYCRIGDGDYAAVSGWPSMTMTHAGDYLGVPATGKALTLRVMDFYRCAGGKIMENWVLLDYGELFHQIGVDLLPGTD